MSWGVAKRVALLASLYGTLVGAVCQPVSILLKVLLDSESHDSLLSLRVIAALSMYLFVATIMGAMMGFGLGLVGGAALGMVSMIVTIASKWARVPQHGYAASLIAVNVTASFLCALAFTQPKGPGDFGLIGDPVSPLAEVMGEGIYTGLFLLLITAAAWHVSYVITRWAAEPRRDLPSVLVSVWTRK
jgi:hypothetical protein